MRVTLDTETRSRKDLKKVGVYSYVADPDFAVLILTYSVDRGPTQVTTNPDQMTQLLTSWTMRGALLVAHNAGFDRVVASEHLRRAGELGPNEFLDPAYWDCTAVRSSEHGLPRHLAEVAKALGCTPKDEAGKALIRLFTRPNRKGGFNDEATHPEQWQRFIAYAIQDTSTLNEVDLKLPGWPTRTERQAWILDQRINDLGLRVDLDLARRAEAAASYNRMVDELAVMEATGIRNPGSVDQMMAWLDGAVPNLQAATVEAALAGDEITDLQRKVLELRQDLALSSASKFTAALTYAATDDRVRGVFQFFGASTGRWCLTGDHEVLTERGWARLDEWTGSRIAVWNSATEALSFQASSAVEFDYDGPVIEYDTIRFKQVSTPEHTMPARHRTLDGVQPVKVSELLELNRPYVPIRGYRDNRAPVTDDALRVLVMVQADGYFAPDGQIRLHFKKTRKVERCRSLLRRAGIAFTERSYEGRVVFTIVVRNQPIWLSMFRDKTFGPWLWDRSPAVFFDELEHWDSYRAGPNSLQYVTTNKVNADMVQAFAHLSGLFCRVKVRSRPEEPTWNDAYSVHIWLDAPEGHELRDKPTERPFVGKVYCAETPTGFFLVRRNGSVWVTGNSGRGPQPQNLPRLAFKSDAEVDAAILDLELGLGGSPSTLKKLVRPMFSGPLTVLDFSAIEARVIAWLADEKWALGAFENGEDIYVATARQLGPEFTRQQGKTCVLALGFAGGIDALKRMAGDRSAWCSVAGVPEDATDEEIDEGLEAVKTAWREANPQIVKLWKRLTNGIGEGGRAGAHLTMRRSGSTLAVHLPSGRSLKYHGVKRERYSIPDPEDPEKRIAKTSWRYIDPAVPKLRTGMWSGSLVENITQGIARDVLVEAMLNLDAAGFTIVGHVHDEVIIEGEHDPEAIKKIMCQQPIWAAGLPLNAEGRVMARYAKE